MNQSRHLLKLKGKTLFRLLLAILVGGGLAFAPARAAAETSVFRGASFAIGNVFVLFSDASSGKDAPQCRMNCKRIGGKPCCCWAPSGKEGAAGGNCGCSMQQTDSPLAAGDAPRLIAGRAALVPPLPQFPSPSLRSVSSQRPSPPDARPDEFVLAVPGPPPRLPFS